MADPTPPLTEEQRETLRELGDWLNEYMLVQHERAEEDAAMKRQCAFQALLAHEAQQQEEIKRLTAERDVERSRFAFNADRFGDLAYDLERLSGSDWGHLRYRVLGTIRAAVKEFRGYAAGQPSPSNWRRRAEVAESALASLREEHERLQRWQDEALAYESRVPHLEDAITRMREALEKVRRTISINHPARVQIEEALKGSDR